MDEKNIGNITKIIVIIGIIFCVISIVFPWRGFSMNFMRANMGVDFYTWAGHFYINTPEGYGISGAMNVDYWSILYMIGNDIFTSNYDNSGYPSFINISPDQKTAAVALMIITFILSMITLFMGILALKKKYASLIAGITSMFSIIFFVVGMSIALSTDSTGMASNVIVYTIGFFMMILTMIIFFISYVLNYFLKATPAQSIQQQSYNPPGVQPPQSM